MVRTLIIASVAALAACSQPADDWQDNSATAEVGTINTLDSGRAAKRLLRDAPKGEVSIRFVSEEPGRSGDPVPLYTLTFGDRPQEDADEWQVLNSADAVQIDSGDGRRLILKDCETHPALCEKIKPRERR